MSKNKKVIIVSVIFVVLLVSSIGLYEYFKPVKDFASSKADITLEAKTLFDAFSSENSRNAANDKYVSDNKTIQVSGIIKDVKMNNDDSTWTISLNAGNPDAGVSCTLMKSESKKAEKLKNGIKVIIKGQCTGYQELIDKEVVMIRCGLQ